MEKDDKIRLEKTISIFNVLYADKIHPCPSKSTCTTIEKQMQDIKDLGKNHDETAKEHGDMIVRLREDPAQEMTDDDYIIHDNYINNRNLFRDGCKEFLDYLITLSEEQALKDGITRSALKKINDILGKSNFGEVVKGILGKVFGETTGAQTTTITDVTGRADVTAERKTEILNKFLETFDSSNKWTIYKDWFNLKFTTDADAHFSMPDGTGINTKPISVVNLKLLDANFDKIGDGKGQLLYPYISRIPGYDQKKYYGKKTSLFDLSRHWLPPNELYNAIINELKNPTQKFYGGKSRKHRTKRHSKGSKKTRKYN